MQYHQLNFLSTLVLRAILGRMNHTDRLRPLPLSFHAEVLRGTWARTGLRWLLNQFIYREGPLDALPKFARDELVERMYEILEPVMPGWLDLPLFEREPSDMAEMEPARAQLRALCTALTTEPKGGGARHYRVPPFSMQLQVSAFLPENRHRRDAVKVIVTSGKTGAIIYGFVRLLEILPAASLLRRCRIPECVRVFLARSGQHAFCPVHQPLMRQERRRAAVQAFRARQRHGKGRAPSPSRRPTRRKR
jgi:hypothetical protein